LGSDLSPEFLKTGTIDATFQEDGKQLSSTYFLNNMDKIGVSLGDHF